MLKRIGALALALTAGAVILPVAAQAQDYCYRPHRAVVGGYVYAPPVYRAPVVVWRDPHRREFERRDWRADRHGYYR